jgi:hypothetical protein
MIIIIIIIIIIIVVIERIPNKPDLGSEEFGPNSPAD